MHQHIDDLVMRLRTEYPSAVAILLKGSHARDEGTPWSDIDFDVLVTNDNTEIYRTWLEDFDGRLVHVSAAVESVDAWIADSDQPSRWSLGLPSIETTRLLWATGDQLRTLLDQPAKEHPAAEPEVEDAVEAFGKVMRAHTMGDDVAVYQNAHLLATLIPTLLIPINVVAPVSNPATALAGVLALKNVPDGFGHNWLTLMGYVNCRTPAQTVDIAQKMLLAVLEMITADSNVYGNDIAPLLCRGALIRYVDQMIALTNGDGI